MIRARGALPAAAAAVCGLWIVSASGATGAPPLRRARLNIVYSASLFRGLNRSDVLAAGKVWVQTIGQRRGFQLDSRIEVLEKLEDIRKRVEENAADMFILDPIEFLSLSRTGSLQPLATMGRAGSGAASEYLLLVSRAAGVHGIENLRGKSINVLCLTEANVGRMWLDVILSEHSLGRPERFFSSVNSASKSSAACLPVYFGSADACIVDRIGWGLLTEMNPQLGAKLAVAEISPPVVESVISLHANHKDFRDELVSALFELHRDPQGAQILLVFKGDRLVPVTAADLAPLKRLWTAYQASRGAAARTGRP